MIVSDRRYMDYDTYFPERSSTIHCGISTEKKDFVINELVPESEDYSSINYIY